MRTVIRSEFTKLATSPTALLTPLIVVGVYGLLLIAPATLYAEALAEIAPDGTIEIFLGERVDARSALTEQLIASSTQALLFLPVVGAVLGGLGTRHGQLGSALVAVPSRTRLFIGKGVAAVVALTVVAAATVAVTSGAMLAVVSRWDPGIVLSGQALAGQARFVLAAVLYSVAAYGLALASRNALVALAALVILTALTLSQVLTGVSPALDALVPLSAARNLLLDPATAAVTSGPGGAIVVIGGWAAGMLICAYATFVSRDAGR